MRIREGLRSSGWQRWWRHVVRRALVLVFIIGFYSAVVNKGFVLGHISAEALLP